ncbi:MAG: hypothetical protein P9L92_14760 [Candidatus Electryonea clarkiae]|nr:hypothetical protein [Candidatus Electryonea clarkiae]MDP8288304.1 hypothetical protein [Candidatus Electryonea clarkiae]
MYRFTFSMIILLLLLATDGYCASGTASGVSNSMNPALSINGLFKSQYIQHNNSADDYGIELQEAEMHFTSVVDPFWKANVIFAVHPEEGQAEYGICVEEASIDALNVPAGFSLKLGKFFVPFGKHAKLHTHAFPFIKAPVAVESFLGEGLSETGVELTASLPVPWYSDLTVYGINGNTAIFDNENKELAYGAHSKNFFDITYNSTIEIGGSLLSGPASEDYYGLKSNMSIIGFDMTYKWISSKRSHGPALTISSEFIMPDFLDDDRTPMGWYAFTQYRFHHNWWIGYTSGLVDCDSEIYPNAISQGEILENKMNLTFAPSEFSALRAEVALYDNQASEEDHLCFTLQWNFTIGSHPAHSY